MLRAWSKEPLVGFQLNLVNQQSIYRTDISMSLFILFSTHSSLILRFSGVILVRNCAVSLSEITALNEHKFILIFLYELLMSFWTP